MSATAAAPRHFQPLAHEAERIGVSTKTLRRRIADGHLTGYRMAGSRLIRLDPTEVDRLLRPIPSAGQAA